MWLSWSDITLIWSDCELQLVKEAWWWTLCKVMKSHVWKFRKGTRVPASLHNPLPKSVINPFLDVEWRGTWKPGMLALLLQDHHLQKTLKTICKIWMNLVELLTDGYYVNWSVINFLWVWICPCQQMSAAYGKHRQRTDAVTSHDKLCRWSLRRRITIAKYKIFSGGQESFCTFSF